MRLNGVLRGRQGGRLSVVLNPLDRETAADLTGLPAFPGTPREMRIGGAVLADVPRGLGLTALQLLPPLKRELIRRLALI